MFFKHFQSYQESQGVDTRRESIPYFIYKTEDFKDLSKQADFLVKDKYYKLAYEDLAGLQASFKDYTTNCKNGNLTRKLQVPIPSILVIHVPKNGLSQWNVIFEEVSKFAAGLKISRIMANSTEHQDTNDLVYTSRLTSLPTEPVQLRICDTVDFCSDEREAASSTLIVALKTARCQDKITGVHTMVNASGMAQTSSGGKWNNNRGGYRGGSRGGGRGGSRGGGFGGRGGHGYGRERSYTMN